MKKMINLVLAVTLSIFMGCDEISDSTPVIPVGGSGTAAVVIGMENSYAGQCPGARYDSKRMSDLLSRFTTNLVYLSDSQATHDRVEAALNAAATYDLCIVYYSGHGGSKAFFDTGAEEDDGRDEYLCLYDRMFRDNEIWSIISKSKGRVFLIFDCCHSKTMFRVPGITLGSARKVMSSRRDGEGFSMLCWSGCPDDSYSYGSNAGGEFTNCLLSKFAENKTYEYLWNEISEDKNLRQSEVVQKTEIGSGFVAKPVFK